MDHTTDSELTGALEGSGEVLAELPLHCIQRNGHLLLALPGDAIAARAVLGLYHPQAALAKLLVLTVSAMIRLRVHFLLPTIKLSVRDNSPLARMLGNPNSIGFLFGNPVSRTRRAIIVYREKNRLLVEKLGLCGGARASVIKEVENIKSLPKANRALPVLVSEEITSDWAAYATGYLKGRSPRKSDDETVLGVLKNWLENGRARVLGETAQWQEMMEYASAHDVGEIWTRLEHAAGIMVRVGIFHGDFAPWNVKVSGESVSVMDWETGCALGPAGWDWLHYIIQRATLVDHHSARKVLSECRGWAMSDTGKGFLNDAGWGEDVECWLGSYLAYSAWIGGYDRAELLSEWVRAKGLGGRRKEEG